MGWLNFLAARAARGALVLLIVLVVNFFLIRLAPGDPALVIAGEVQSDDPAYLAQLRTQLGLDQPLPQQLAHYLGGVLRGELGHSARNHEDVAVLIAERLPATLLLLASAFVFSALAGIALGALAAWARQARRTRWLDGAIFTGAMVLYATPTFWLSLMLVIVFSVGLDWLPAFGCRPWPRAPPRAPGPMLSTWPPTWCCRRWHWAACTWRSTCSSRAARCST